MPHRTNFQLRWSGQIVGVILIGCGSDSHRTSGDAPKLADSEVGCRAEPIYSDFGSNVRGYGLDYPTKATGSATTTHAQVVVQTLNATDVMFLQLDAEFGAFRSGDIVTGSYVLGGDDLDPSLCGICLYVWPKSLSGTSLDAVNKDYLQNQRYIAVAGEVRLNTAGGSANGSNTISGSVSNVSFKHAIIQNDGSFQYAPDACTTSLGSGDFGPYKLTVGTSGSGSAAPDPDIHVGGFDMPSGAVKLRRRSAE